MSDPGGELLVTPAGSTVVSTDAMLAAADRFRSLEVRLHGDLRMLLAADREPLALPIQPDLVPALRELAERCRIGCEGLRRAAEDYTGTERLVDEAQRTLAAMFAALIAANAPTLVLATLVAAPQLVWSALAASFLAPGDLDDQSRAVQSWFLAHPELITSPAFARLVSHLATSVDDAMLAAAGMPPAAAGWPGFEIGTDGGVAAGGILIMAIGQAIGAFTDSPVAVTRTGTTTGAVAPTGVADRLSRVPEGDDQIRIDRYDEPGMAPRYTVYIGPTGTFSPFPSDEPFDLQSNVNGVATHTAASLRAVEAAMSDAGVRPGDEVQVVGFSQGGLVAALVASSADWNVVGIETHGGPTGGIPLPDGIAGMTVRHTDDLVPALAPPQHSTAVLQVEREAFAGEAPIPDDIPAPAHQRETYLRTAAAIDEASSSAIRAQVLAMDRFGSDYLEAGGKVTSMTYHATRVTADDLSVCEPSS